MFFRACRNHSTKSAKWGGGAFDTICPLVCKWGATAPYAPGSATYDKIRYTAGRWATEERIRGNLEWITFR